ncbi:MULTISPECIES: hypothetical protein [unclassified Pseudomonas]|uniref:hypothetical protein n=1 Tax=unclassified Pseudomonas TaxID=196821 RepID=UPI00128F258C|nr:MULTISPECIES: hypothetical protein [unclassified Pseudomonas]MDI9779836.1 hypothetical protein [Pseudomonas putida]MQG96153.1 hypothetical protein [Pseudomonas sp. MN1F]
MRQDDRDNLELDRLLIENHKLRAEASKFLAEASKLKRETFWYPYVVGSAALGAIGTIISLLTR